MAVTRLALTDFRSYATLRLDAAPGLVVLTGENGAGKTNILEALSLLGPGRGLRMAALSDMARSDGPGGFAVAATLAGGTEIGTGTLATVPERRQVRINGAASAANAMAEWLALVWLTPAMDRLFTDPASGRRRFLDRLVLALEPAHAGHAARYEAAMRQRNKLLADPGGADPAWLDALEQALATHGIALASARARMLAALDARLAAQPDDPFARPALGCIADGGGHESAEALAAALRRGRARDAAAGRTLAGPHRDDLLVTHVGKNQPAERCSTGEQKALLLSIVLAHADLVASLRGARPILLLDEVAAHLDPHRRGALFERLLAGGGQVWMTGTETALFAQAPAATLRLCVSAGRVEPA